MFILDTEMRTLFFNRASTSGLIAIKTYLPFWTTF